MLIVFYNTRALLSTVPIGSSSRNPAHDEANAPQGPLREILRKRHIETTYFIVFNPDNSINGPQIHNHRRLRTADPY